MKADKRLTNINATTAWFSVVLFPAPLIDKTYCWMTLIPYEEFNHLCNIMHLIKLQFTKHRKTLTSITKNFFFVRLKTNAIDSECILYLCYTVHFMPSTLKEYDKHGKHLCEGPSRLNSIYIATYSFIVKWWNIKLSDDNNDWPKLVQ